MIKNKKQFIFLATAVFLFFGAIFPGCSPAPVSVDGGVYKSIDGGLTWERKIQLIQPPETKVKTDLSAVSFTSFAINPDDSNIIYATTPGNGLYVTKDAGENWDLYNGTGLIPGLPIFSLAIDRKNVKNMYLAGVSTYGKGNVMKSEDEGATWQEVYVTVSAGEYVNKIEIDQYETSIIYITTTLGQLFKSTNYGRSWSTMTRFATVVSNFAVSPKDTRVLYATSAAEGLFKSTNKGDDWQPLAESLTKVTSYTGIIDVIALDPIDSNIIYIGFTNGMLKSTDGGNTWSSFNLLTPPATLTMNSLIISQTDSKSIYYTVGSQVYFTNNGVESNWLVRNLPTSRVLTGLTIDPKDPKIIYVGTIAPPPPPKKMF
jgi:photosystem II stability/assembly factor-like uncharacterized protein